MEEIKMNNTYHVLVVEDDFRIADINRQFVEKVEGFIVQHTVKTGEDALIYLQQANNRPHIVLLDIYIPDVDGLELFWKIRSNYHDIDIIIVSAATQSETVRETLRGGAFDYIVKPADVNRFKMTLTTYKQQQDFIESMEYMDQDNIDIITGTNNKEPVSASAKQTHLPKGIDSITLNNVTDLLESSHREGITAVELCAQIGTSRSTSRRYLEYLVAKKIVKTKLKYGNVGRPERVYIPRETYEQNEANNS